jgi:hypothetical protein
MGAISGHSISGQGSKNGEHTWNIIDLVGVITGAKIRLDLLYVNLENSI